MADENPNEEDISFCPPVPPAKPDYVVGYKRPPKASQIKPGEIRNPRGKRKGTRSLKSDIVDVLKMPVALRDGGGTVSTRKASLLKIRELMLRGNLRAADRLLELAMLHADEEDATSSTAGLMEEDARILAHARERDRIAALANSSVTVPDPQTGETQP